MSNNTNKDPKFGFSITYCFEMEDEMLDDGTIIKKITRKREPEIKQDVLWENGLPYLQ